jgi:hypothetical protein
MCMRMLVILRIASTTHSDPIIFTPDVEKTGACRRRWFRFQEVPILIRCWQLYKILALLLLPFVDGDNWYKSI